MSTRRRFIQLVSLGLGALVALPARLARARTLGFRISKIPKLEQINGWAEVDLNGKRILFVRDSESTIKALDPFCTHRRCQLQYDPELGHLVCPCHRSAFDLDGQVVTRPAREPLPTYPARLDGAHVVVEVEDA